MHETDTDVVTTVDGNLLAEVTDLLQRVQAVSALPGLSEDRRRALDRAATSDEERLLAVRMRDRSDGRLVGYAQIDGTDDSGFDLEVVVLPASGSLRPSEDTGPTEASQRSASLLGLAVNAFSAHGGGRLRLWVANATEADDRRAGDLGLSFERELMQLRCHLPLKPRGTPGAEELPIRPFRIGRDEDQWLAVNNRAFAAHPEQGRWDLATIHARESEPWFDPEGFLVLDADGRMAGFCWTKVHADALPPMGEIYVIGVDPDFHGRGWGRSLTQAGFDWMATVGLTVGMLYVDVANTTAVALYRSMGMEVHHVNRAYVATVSPKVAD